MAQLKSESVVLGTLVNYKSWLETLNYSATTIKNNPKYVREFIVWSKITALDEITKLLLERWFKYLSERKNRLKGGGLSLNYIKGYRNALSQFNRFLRETGKGGFDLDIQLKVREEKQKEILTQKEIQRLYEATNYYTDPGIKNKGLLAARERAILGLFYGCGVRKNEGVHVEIKDLDFKQNLLYVRKGKNYKERFVPIPAGVKKDFIHYLNYARPQLLRGKKHEGFIIGWTGSPLQGNGMMNRIHILAAIAGINQSVGLHKLRHSIATHLLQSGMKLEQIARFLGHSSLESTTIYTRVEQAYQ